MATGNDPLRREQIGVIAQAPGARITAPQTNAALQLADSLKGLAPEAGQLMAGIAKDRAEAERARAAKDALEQSGSKLADAVREGKLRPTQNPWYVKAYNTESAAIRGQKALTQLQVDSQSWDTQDDPAAFDKQWRDSVAELSKGFEDKDSFAGFSPVANQYTQQALATNTAKNAQRIETERKQNIGALSTDALVSKLRSAGGTITPNEAFQALLPSKQNWFATGGDADSWNEMMVDAVTAAAYSAQDPNLLDLLKAPELRFGPSSDAGGVTLGSGARETSDTPSYAPPTVTQTGGLLKIDLPKQAGFASPPVAGGRITSRFGTRSAPIAGASTDHKGVDIAVPLGTPVKAPAAGRVVFAGKDGKSGNVVRIDHGNGIVTAYAHLGSFNVEVGEVITPGQTLAKSGNTGNSTGPHLHWSVKENGKSVNPLTFKGELGGSIEGEATGKGSQMEALSGFPGQDQPFKVNAPAPSNHYASGPSLYNMPGVADKVESDRYRIRQAAEDAPLQKLRILTNERKAKAAEAGDWLAEKYGTGLLTGDFDRDTLIKELSGQGYSVPVIAQVFNDLRGQVTDSAGLQDARIAARSGTSQASLQVMNLALEGSKGGWSQAYEDKVADAVMAGTISGSDGQSMIVGSLNRNRQLESEAKGDRAEARAEARANQRPARGAVDTASELKQEAANLTALVISKARQMPGTRNNRSIQNEEYGKRLEALISQKMRAYLAAHPGDYEGALGEGRAAAAAAVLSFSREPSKPSGQTSSGSAKKPAPRPSSSNPLG